MIKISPAAFARFGARVLARGAIGAGFLVDRPPRFR